MPDDSATVGATWSTPRSTDDPFRPRPRRARWRGGIGPILVAVSAGGVLGALARYALGAALPHTPGAFPTGTLLANLVGCFLIGALMVLVNEIWHDRRLLRPFLGVGLLGGFTTFSTYAVDVFTGIGAGAYPTVAAYLVGTVVGALLAVLASTALTRFALSRLRPARGGLED